MPISEHEYFGRLEHGLRVAADAALQIGRLRDGDIRWGQISALIDTIREQAYGLDNVAIVNQAMKDQGGLQ